MLRARQTKEPCFASTNRGRQPGVSRSGPTAGPDTGQVLARRARNPAWANFTCGQFIKCQLFRCDPIAVSWMGSAGEGPLTGQMLTGTKLSSGRAGAQAQGGCFWRTPAWKSPRAAARQPFSWGQSQRSTAPGTEVHHPQLPIAERPPHPQHPECVEIKPVGDAVGGVGRDVERPHRAVRHGSFLCLLDP